MSHEERVSWLPFMVSARLFGGSRLRSGDPSVVAGSAVFGLACVIVLLRSRSEQSEDLG